MNIESIKYSEINRQVGCRNCRSPTFVQLVYLVIQKCEMMGEFISKEKWLSK